VILDRLMHSMPVLAQAGEGSGKSLLEYVRSGREIGVVIILLSFVAVGLIITQFVRIRLSRLAPDRVREALEEMMSKRDVRGAIAYCQDPENDSFLSRVLGAALVRCSRSPFGFLELKSAIEEAGQQETARLYRATDAIGVIASIAPMLGLLGTVVGMVGAFDTISVTEGVTKPDQLAGSISQALITTVMGLIVAIPTTAAYAFLRNRIDSLVALVAEMTDEMAVHVEAGGGQRPQRPAPPGAQGAARPAGSAGQPTPGGARA